MSWQPPENPTSMDAPACPAVETVITPRAKDLGGFEVRRVLPSARRRAVGPFVFFDQAGPSRLNAGEGVDVRPHPHIGLATLTWLIDGELVHRDSLGSFQPIRPGEVNWMIAGSGIAHSERTPDALRAGESRLYGIQTWLALPKPHEETAPAFEHYPADAIPRTSGDGLELTLIAGTGWGLTSPVSVFSKTVYADVRAASGAVLTVPDEHEERAVYVLEGGVEVGGKTFDAGAMLVLAPRGPVDVRMTGPGHILVLGGEATDGPRHMWWNFVHSDKDRIEQAKADWKAGRFAKVVDDDEIIPLPED